MALYETTPSKTIPLLGDLERHASAFQNIDLHAPSFAHGFQIAMLVAAQQPQYAAEIAERIAVELAALGQSVPQTRWHERVSVKPRFDARVVLELQA